ncbi:MAG: glycosyltransferase [Polyangiaceae bacterium]
MMDILASEREKPPTAVSVSARARFVPRREAPRVKTLLLLGKAPSADSVSDADAGRIPRIEYIELARALGATILDYHDVARSTHPAVVLARRQGPKWGLAALGTLQRHAFDRLYVTGEDVGLPLAMMLHGTAHYGRTTVVVHNGGTPKRRLLLRALGHAVWRDVICLSERQRHVLVDEIGLPAHKVHAFQQWIDERFYRPPAPDIEGDYVFACGRESRDYPLLQQAAGSLPHVPFRAVASGWAPHAGFDPADNLYPTTNLRVEHNLSYLALRDAYAAARFVVVPVANVDYAAGVTGICEAMAMGKAVIATASPGVADYVRHGESGLVVPLGDAPALRAAIAALWADPARCAQMGRHNRAWVERELSVTQYVSRVAGLSGIRVEDRP